MILRVQLTAGLSQKLSRRQHWKSFQRSWQHDDRPLAEPQKLNVSAKRQSGLNELAFLHPLYPKGLTKGLPFALPNMHRLAPEFLPDQRTIKAEG